VLQYEMRLENASINPSWTTGFVSIDSGIIGELLLSRGILEASVAAALGPFESSDLAIHHIAHFKLDDTHASTVMRLCNLLHNYYTIVVYTW